MTGSTVHVIGGGLAGCEAAWQIARAGARAVLHEMRPLRATAAHRTDSLAELVCSNSFRSDDAEGSAIGLLHEEMRRCGSLILATADAHQVPAGGALAVDREGFSRSVQAALENEPRVSIDRGEVTGLPPEAWSQVIVATGPLTSPGLAEAVGELTGAESLAFFDAIAPIVHRDSIDMTKAWRQSRYDKPGPGGDAAAYINCPLDEAQYDAFVDGLLEGEKTPFHEWERDTPDFDGCLPVETMAVRGRQTLRFGPMKPVGLTNRHAPDEKPYAVVQLRQDNALGTLFNMVGFQTKLKHGEQTRLFRTVPGLENARFARLGGAHRNMFINSPRLLDRQLRLKALPRLRFAGQITGVEGYVESAATGLLAGRFAAGKPALPPPETCLGALLGHITGGGDAATFQPMNANFGLFPPLEDRVGKRERKRSHARRALAALDRWLAGGPPASALAGGEPPLAAGESLAPGISLDRAEGARG